MSPGRRLQQHTDGTYAEAAPCGPVAIAALTGESMDRVLWLGKALRLIHRDGMSSQEATGLLCRIGFDAKTVHSDFVSWCEERGRAVTQKQLRDYTGARPGRYLAASRNHYWAYVDGVEFDVMVDEETPRARTRVQELWIVEPKEVSSGAKVRRKHG